MAAVMVACKCWLAAFMLVEVAGVMTVAVGCSTLKW